MDWKRSRALGLYLVSLPMLAGVSLAQSKPGEWLTMKHGDLCVTEGSIEQAAGDRLSVNVPKMRAYVTVATSPSAEIRFRYQGATKSTSALGSGQVRSQFGLKLHAQDPCNLVYVMWRVTPESKLVVSVKRNPTQHTSAECSNHGYTNIKARKASPVAALRAGDSHTMRTEMKGEDLRVFVDNKEVWEGVIGADAAGLHGPVGIRSDNAHIEFDYLARKPAEGSADHAEACRAGDSD